MSLSPLDILNGTLGVSFCTLSIALGLSLLIKYFQNKNKNFILTGLTLIFMTSGWFGTSLSFVVAIFFQNDGLPLVAIMLLNFLPLPISLISWVIFFTDIILLKYRGKLIIGTTIAFTAFFYIAFLTMLFIDVSLVSEKISPVDTKGNSWFLNSFIFIYVAILIITGVKFAWETMKFEDPEMKIKGKILMGAFPLFAIGGILDSSLPSNEITLIIFRGILITSVILFYFGFFLPNWLKNQLIEKKVE
ncbi:MAG: conserved membrane protein of unknown function [Promethearchaeota archaeon]|nr:MAG: conserved membrane protein of unknown function [Candidatus Lokiarchaeota archaeon]